VASGPGAQEVQVAGPQRYAHAVVAAAGGLD
jgi:hypothetical protein